MNTKDKGDLAELCILLNLKEQGFAVSIPYGENCPYDLIAESSVGELFRVQVRYATWRYNGTLPLRLRSISKNYCRSLDFTRIDIFALWDGKQAYFIPISEIGEVTAEFTLRETSPKNGQKSRIHMAKQYRNNYSWASSSNG